MASIISGRLLLLVVLLQYTQVYGLSSSEIQEFESQSHLQITGTSDNGPYYVIQGKGDPIHATGTFPGKGNPNSIETQTYDFHIPKIPINLDAGGCLPMGIIALAINGIPMFNPYTAFGTNAFLTETFDVCNGHPDMQGRYHYHARAECLTTNKADQLMGAALDGYPIYNSLVTHPKTGQHITLTSADLDECHGSIKYNANGHYRYYITSDFPYILGCYRGYVDTSLTPGQKNRPGRSPPCYFARYRPDNPDNPEPSSPSDLVSGTVNNGQTDLSQPSSVSVYDQTTPSSGTSSFKAGLSFSSAVLLMVLVHH